MLSHRRRVRQQAFHQFTSAGGVGGKIVRVPQHGPDVEILQRAGGLNQRCAHKGAACLIGGKHDLPRGGLGVQLAVAVHQHRAAAALEKPLVLPDGGQHGVPAQIHAAVQQRNGEQHPPPLHGMQLIRPLKLHVGAALQRVSQHRRQPGIFLNLRTDDHQRFHSLRLLLK